MKFPILTRIRYETEIKHLCKAIIFLTCECRLKKSTCLSSGDVGERGAWLSSHNCTEDEQKNKYSFKTHVNDCEQIQSTTSVPWRLVACVPRVFILSLYSWAARLLYLVFAALDVQPCWLKNAIWAETGRILDTINVLTVDRFILINAFNTPTALELPPTCIHLSWNQDQLKSSSVDLWNTKTGLESEIKINLKSLYHYFYGIINELIYGEWISNTEESLFNHRAQLRN